MTAVLDRAVGLRLLVPFGGLSATYFAHIGFFNPYLPLWLKAQGLDGLTVQQAVTHDLVRAEVQVVSIKVAGGAARMPRALLELIVKG